MAIVYYTSHPLRVKETKKFEFAGGTSFYEIVNELKAFNRELNVNINGHEPDEISLNQKINQNDVVYIRTNVLGRSSRETNKIADVVSVVSIVAATVGSIWLGGIPGALLASGISVAGGLTTASIRRKAAKQLQAERGKPTNAINSAAFQVFNTSTARNDIAPYAPIPIVMGEHRLAPPFASLPYDDYSEPSDPTNDEGLELVGTRTYNGYIKFDVFDPNYSWTTITVTILSNNYSVQIPTHIYSTNFLSTASNVTDYIDDLLTLGTGFLSSGSNQIQDSNYPNSILSHELILRFQTSPYTNQYFTEWSLLNVFDPTNLTVFENSIKTKFAQSAFTPGTIADAEYLDFEPNDLTFYETLTTPNVVAPYLSVNFDTSYFRPKENGGNNQKIYHIFNFGFGDLTISDERIGDSLLPTKNLVKRYNLEDSTWKFANGSGTRHYPQGGNTAYYNTLQIEGADLRNNDPDFPVWAVIGTDQTTYNWIYRTSPDNTKEVGLNFTISSYLFDAGAFEIFTSAIQAQYREVGDTVWLPIKMTAAQQTSLLTGGSSGIFAPSGDGVIRVGNRLDFLGDWALSWFFEFPTTSKYEVRIRKMNYDGYDFTSDVSLTSKTILNSVNFYIDYDAPNYVGQNRASLVIKASQEFNGSIEKYNALVKAKTYKYFGSGNIYNWDFTSNPADWFLYMLRGCYINTTNPSGIWPVGLSFEPGRTGNKDLLFGAGLEDDKIDFDSIKSWWNFCDDNELEFNAVLSSTDNLFDVLNDIAAAGRASVSFASGKVGVVYESQLIVPVAMFGMDNIIKNSFNIKYIVDDDVDAYTVSFVDKDSGYSENEVTALKDGVTDPAKFSTIKIWGITNKTQAQKEANLIAARTHYQRRLINFTADVEGLILTRGDVILLQHDITQWSYSFRPIKFELTGNEVTKIYAPCELPSTTHILVRSPDGTMTSYETTVSGNEIVLDEQFLASMAPQYVDQTNTENPYSANGKTPEDYLIFAGFSDTPAKPVKIVDIKYDGFTKMVITCVDEEAAIYGQEYDNLPTPIAFAPYTDYDYVIAKAFNLDYKLLGDGKAQIFWELENANGATGTISVNSSIPVPLIVDGSQSLFSDSALIDYSSGDTILITISPFVIGSVNQTISATVSFTLE